MFGLSFSEVLIIGVVALLVLGPERLPKVARTVGHLMGRAQRYMSDIKSDIQREMDIEELKKIKNDMQASANQVQESFHQTMADMHALKQETTRDLPDLNALRPQRTEQKDVSDTTPKSS